jgi:hypothetical protein
MVGIAIGPDEVALLVIYVFDLGFLAFEGDRFAGETVPGVVEQASIDDASR